MVCRDGKTEVDWLEEMLQYTITQPSISFSCNPLNFDFTNMSAKKLKVPAAQSVEDAGNLVETKGVELVLMDRAGEDRPWLY